MAQISHLSILQNNDDCLLIQVLRTVESKLNAGKAFFGVEKC